MARLVELFYYSKYLVLDSNAPSSLLCASCLKGYSLIRKLFASENSVGDLRTDKTDIHTISAKNK